MPIEAPACGGAPRDASLIPSPNRHPSAEEYLMPLKSIYDQQSIFKSYLERTNEKDIFVAKFAERFSLPRSSPANLLDLGCHDGTLTMRLLDAVSESLPEHSVVTCAEPSERALRVFENRPLPAKYRFLFFNETAESYFRRSTNMFDWIIASHCLYWSRSLEGVLTELCKKAEQSVVVLRGRRGIHQIQSKFKEWVGSPDEQLYTADRVESALDHLGVSFVREDIASTTIIPERDDPTLTLLFAFFLQRAAESFDSEMIDEVYQFTKQMGDNLTHDVSFFWIRQGQVARQH
jgi:ubiquinone/menaquinone biosynthesis C-methylase UbiE